VKNWEIIADNLSKAGWSWSRVSAVAFLRANKSSKDSRDDGKSLLDYVIRRFNLSSARLNKPQGLDLRWDTV